MSTLVRQDPVAAPSARWLGRWAAERFPLRNLLFFAPLFAAAQVGAPGARGGPIVVRGGALIDFAAFWSFFLLLRVYDEHKDFAADALAHPQRVLQRGLVSLAQLRVLAGLSIALQLGASLARDGGVPGAATAWWLAAMGWSALMAREFFAPRWLRAHLVIYAVSHMLVMPLLIAWAAAMAGADGRSVGAITAVAVLAFTDGLAVEIARKLRAPEDERPTADSYTQSLGMRGALAAATGTVLGASVLALLAAHTISGSTPALLLVAVAVAATFAIHRVVAFGRAPNAARAAGAEAAVALSVVVGLAGVIGTAVATRGWVLR